MKRVCDGASVEHALIPLPGEIIGLLVIGRRLLQGPAHALGKQASARDLRQADAHGIHGIVHGKRRRNGGSHEHGAIHAVAPVIHGGVAERKLRGLFRFSGEHVAVAVGACPCGDALQVGVSLHAGLRQGSAAEQMAKHGALAPPAAFSAAGAAVLAERKIFFPDAGKLILRQIRAILLHGKKAEQGVDRVVVRRDGIHTGFGEIALFPHDIVEIFRVADLAPVIREGVGIAEPQGPAPGRPDRLKLKRGAQRASRHSAEEGPAQPFRIGIGRPLHENPGPVGTQSPDLLERIRLIGIGGGKDELLELRKGRLHGALHALVNLFPLVCAAEFRAQAKIQRKIRNLSRKRDLLQASGVADVFLFHGGFPFPLCGPLIMQQPAHVFSSVLA